MWNYSSLYVVQYEEMTSALVMMSELSDDLPMWTAGNRRRAGYRLDNEWTRSVEFIFISWTL